MHSKMINHELKTMINEATCKNMKITKHLKSSLKTHKYLENLPLRYPNTSCIQVQFCMHLPECPCSSQASKFWRNLRAKSHQCWSCPPTLQNPSHMSSWWSHHRDRQKNNGDLTGSKIPQMICQSITPSGNVVVSLVNQTAPVRDIFTDWPIANKVGGAY